MPLEREISGALSPFAAATRQTSGATTLSYRAPIDHTASRTQYDRLRQRCRRGCRSSPSTASTSERSTMSSSGSLNVTFFLGSMQQLCQWGPQPSSGLARACATPSTPMPCCGGWSHTTPAPSSKPTNADSLHPELRVRPAPYALSSVLTCCDMTTSPDGEPVPVDRRLAEIHDRYGPGHLVSRSIQRATPMILRAVEQVHQRAAQTT